MGIFRRKEPRLDDPRPAIARFWDWWAARRDAVIAAAVADEQERLAELLGPAVASIDPALEWEFIAGSSARHRLIVTGGNRPALRAVAERWYLAAPDADEQVEFAPVRESDVDALSDTILVEGFELPMPEFVAGTRVDPQRQRLDLVVHHPLYPLIGAEARRDVAFRALRVALGDDDIERWLGAVEVSADAPIDAVALSALPMVVEQLRPRNDLWAVLRGRSTKGPVVATVRRPFTRADRPLCDTHVAVLLTFPKGPDGLPADGKITSTIQDLQQRLAGELGGDGPHVALIGYEISDGRAVVHLYVDGLVVDTKPAKPVLATWEHGVAKLETKPDPAWREVAHLLG